MNFLNLLHISYFFDNNQTSTFFGYWPLVGVLLMMVIVGYVIAAQSRKMANPMRHVASKLAHASVLVGWLGLAYMFFRYQGAMFLEWRLWPVVLFIYLLWQIWLSIRYVRVDYPKKIAAKDKVGDKETYLQKYQKKRK